jgi:hypothetical protein
MDPPPWHVHVEIEASIGSSGLGVQELGSPHGAHRVTDALLNPVRARAVSLG